MRDIAAVEFGAKMSQASCHHSKFSPRNILDREISRPWVSTGLYPQFFVITFPDLMQIHSIDIKAFNVQLVSVERCATEATTGYEVVSEKKLTRTHDKLQNENLTSHEFPARHLKFEIKSGYDSFCAVYGVRVMGSTLSGRSPMPVRKADIAKMLEPQYEGSRLRTQNLVPKRELDVVDSDLYPRHIATGPAEYETVTYEAIVEDRTESHRRFQSAFKVPKNRKIIQSKIVANSEDSDSGKLIWNEDDEEGDDEQVDLRFNFKR